MNFITAFHSDKGTQKAVNQDSLLLNIAETDKGKVLLAAVCDGMGGLYGGEMASASVISALDKWFKSTLPRLLNSSDVINETTNSLGEFIKRQNSNIYNYSTSKKAKMGTTLTGMLVFENGQAVIIHVGDTRIYRIGSNALNIITNDHSLVAEEYRKKIITYEQAKKDPRQNILTKCIGASNKVEPDLLNGYAEKDFCYLLCSDGFRYCIEDSEICAAFSPKTCKNSALAEQRIADAVSLARSRGESDDISVIMLKLK